MQEGLLEVIKLVQAQRAIKLAKSHLQDVRSRLNKAFADLNVLAEALNDKYESIEALEAKSLNNVFKSILGSRADQLEMERQEYLQVVLQYNEAKKSIELLEYEESVLAKQVNQEAIIDLQLEKAIAVHRADLLKAFPYTANDIIAIEKQISFIAANTKELQEALDVANQLVAILDIIIKNLDRASNWGDWEDLPLSRRIEVKAKNQFVDKALAKVYEAQLLFEKFEKELQDIHNHQQIAGSYHFHDFGNFTEVYYNRLIADWVIQKQIKNSRQNVEGVRDNVIMIKASLEHEITKSTNAISGLEEDITDVIKSSIPKD